MFGRNGLETFPKLRHHTACILGVRGLERWYADLYHSEMSTSRFQFAVERFQEPQARPVAGSLTQYFGASAHRYATWPCAMTKAARHIFASSPNSRGSGHDGAIV